MADAMSAARPAREARIFRDSGQAQSYPKIRDHCHHLRQLTGRAKRPHAAERRRCVIPGHPRRRTLEGRGTGTGTGTGTGRGNAGRWGLRRPAADRPRQISPLVDAIRGIANAVPSHEQCKPRVPQLSVDVVYI
jgi:hypothetical protein